MADNTPAYKTADALTLVDTFATDDIAGVKYPRTKLTIGADGTNDGDVSSANPLPISGAVTVSGVATAAKQDTGNTSIASIDTKTPALGQALAAASVPVVLTAAQLTTLTPLATIAATQSGTWTEANSAAIAASLSVVDDWDESDRCKVNPISGQVGVAGGSGVVGATTQRVVLATDVALPTGANVIGALSNNQTVNLNLVAGTSAAVNNGAASAGTQRVTIANDSTGILAGVTSLTGSSIAHDAVDSGNPHKIGAKATTSLAGVTLVADADRTNLFAGVDGVLIVRPHCNLEDVVQDRATNTDGASTAFAGGLAAPGSGVRLWVKNVDVCNTSAATVTLDLRDGSAGSVLWTLPVPPGGCVKPFDPPLKLSANTALAYDASAATTTLTISANGFKSKV